MKAFSAACTALALGLGAAIPGAQAEQTHDAWYVAPALNFVIADRDRGADDDFGLELGIGRELGRFWNLELNLEMDHLDFSEGGGKYKQRGASLDGLFFFHRSRFSPYALVGVGGLQNRVPQHRTTNLMANAGLGFLTNTGGPVSLRGEVRYRLDNDGKTVPTESRFGDWIISLGLQVAFGQSTPASAAPAPAPAPEPEPAPTVVDSDGDGVPDDIDECPGTRPGAVVDERGCEPDSDSDGVPDVDDRCPDTPAGAEVDEFGCERDSDGDGVVDRLDRCPDTRPGARVDIHGCEIVEVTTLEGVTFGLGSAELHPSSTRTLDETAATLRKHPEIHAEIAGHSDSTGPRALNLRLSRERADAVRDYLIGQGVAPDRLVATGVGPDQPIADNGTAEGRAANRRVELKIIE